MFTRMSHSSLLVCAWFACGLVSAAQANLIRNASFETASGITDQAQLPTDWFQVDYPPPYAGADTYSTDGTNGLSPSANGNFTGVSAHDGVRFVAGADIESFGQTLTSPLTPGQRYDLSAWLHRALRFDLAAAGGYEVYLATASYADRVKVATLGPTVGAAETSPQWEYFSASFTAPANAADLPVIICDPFGIGAYPAMDELSLTPEPASLSVLALSGLVLVRRRATRK